MLECDSPGARRHAADVLAGWPKGWPTAMTADDLDLLIEAQVGYVAEVRWPVEITTTSRFRTAATPDSV